MGRSDILGWSRLERINNLIEDEKREITTNRDEEKAELTAIYQAKGFSEPLLSKVIDVLMADDNKLLSIMLEEELGMSLESYEHPLKQAAGTGIGILLTVALFSLLTYFYTIPGLYAATFVTIAAASFFMAKLESVRPLNAIVWNLALTALAAASTFLLMRIL